MKSAAAAYSVLVGLFIIVFWLVQLVTNPVPSDQKRYAISFHLAGEFLTAILLIASGAGTWIGKQWSKMLSPVALGLLLYTVIVSPGYCAQLGDVLMVGMFMVLTAFTVLAIAIQKKNPSATMPR